MEKIKQFLTGEQGKDILTVIIVILVGLGSFGLGRLSKQSSSAGIKIEYPSGMTAQTLSPETQTANIISSVENTPKANSNTNSTGKNFFASNRGSKYYSLGCSGGKSLKMENRIYFATKEEAEAAGYELSGSCK